MTIKKIFSRSKKGKGRAGWKWDARSQNWYSYGFQLRLADGTRKQVSGFPTRSAAEQAAANIRLGEQAGKYGIAGPQTAPTLAELVAKRIAATEGPELGRIKRVLGAWLELLPAGLRIIQVTTNHLRLYTDARAEQVKPATVNRELNTIAATLNMAGEFYPSLTQWRTPKIPRPKMSKRGRERVITADEATRILNHLLAPRQPHEFTWEADARVKAGLVFKFALLTGARHGEINNLRWEDIDWQAKVLQIRGTKNEFVRADSIRYLTITDALMDILLERRKVSEDPFVFSSHGTTNPNYYGIIKRCCAKLGIPYGRNTPNGWVTHDLRHSVVTRLLQAGVDLSTIGSITGHGDRTLILHYGHASSASKKQAAEVLEDFVTGSLPSKNGPSLAAFPTNGNGILPPDESPNE